MSISQEITTLKAGRIGYIDAMRGFTMLLVVFSHVLVKCFCGTPLFSFNAIFITFRMPLFFFISGFLMYKEGRFVSSSLGFYLWEKFKVQIIPTVFFASLFCFLWHINARLFIMDDAKMGYWFTYILFFYYLTFAILFFLFYSFNRKLDDRVIVLFVFLASFCVTFFSYFVQTSHCSFNNWNGLRILSSSKFCYFSFFCFGSLIKVYFSKFQKMLDNSTAMAVVVLLEIAVLLFKLLSSDINGSVIIVSNIILGFLGIIIVFAFFRNYKCVFEGNGKTGRLLRYIGVRTLDVYLIHYFILPRHLTFIGRFFETYNNPILELFSGLLVALMVIAVSLVISSIMRLSASLAKGLFGKVLI